MSTSLHGVLRLLLEALGEDLGALGKKVTPEMLSYFSEELADNQSRGVVNRISDVKLLQGDLAESWREAGENNKSKNKK